MKRSLSLILAALMIAAAAALAVPASAASPFDDVKDTRWSYSSIVYAVNAGYMKGTGERIFSPAGTLTRAMVATVLWRRQGSPAPTAPSGFSDVPEGKWYSDAIAWAKESGVVQGVSDTKFKPNDNVTREQLATMLYRFSETAPVCVPERADLGAFPDGSSVHGWAAEAMGWAVEAALVKGSSDGSLDPAGYATREQFAAIIERFDYSFKLEYRDPVPRTQYTEPERPLVGDADFYVSTTGDDSADGSFEHPFRTWERAAEAVRSLDKTGRGGITVAFFAGDYGAIGVKLRSEDSGTSDCPVTYCAYGDGDVVFNNGFDVREDEFVPISADEKALFSDKAAGSIKKADISDRLRNYDPLTCLVLSDDGDMTLARYPNKYADGTDQLLTGAHENVDENHIRIDHGLLIKRIKNYHTTEGLLLYGYLTTGWFKDLLETADYDPDAHLFLIPHPEKARMGYLRRLPEFDSKAWSQVAVVNVSEELDAQGEYWIDAASGTFYVYDPAGDCHFTAGEDTMLTLIGTEYVTLEGLSFSNSNGRMIHAANHPRGFTVENCSFTGCAGDYMVTVEGGRDGVPFDVTVRGCEFSVCAEEALRIDGYSSSDAFGTGTNVLIDNNLFTLTCLRVGNKAALAIRLPDPLITHNIFRKCYWEAIRYGGCVAMVAEYNVFEQTGYNGDDTGAFQNFRDVTFAGNVVRNNLFMNIGGGTNGRYALYLDGSSGITIESNIFFNCASAVMNNGMSKLNYTLNNIFISPEEPGAECTVHAEGHWLVDEAKRTGDLSVITDDYGYSMWTRAFNFYESHPDAKAKAAELWPEYFNITMDLDRIDEPESFVNSTVVCTGNASIKNGGEFAENEEIDVRHSVFENNAVYPLSENPFFVNPSVGDYRIRGGSDYSAIEFEKIGRY